MRRIIMFAAAAFAWSAGAQTTTMQVPQGSGNYATIGQIECLEEESSGRYCAATWECADGSSGELWRDMENHNGRRTIVPDHPIANRRDCTVRVDGKAAVQWFHGFRPQGRDGSVVGIANAVDALRPVQERPETNTMVGDSGGSLAEYILDKHNTSLREMAEDDCGDGETARVRRICIDQYPLNHASLVAAMGARATPWLRCAVDHFDEFCNTLYFTHSADSGSACNSHESARYLLGMIGRQHICGNEGRETTILCAPNWEILTYMGGLARYALAEGPDEGLHSERQDGFDHCWELAEEELERQGVEVGTTTRGGISAIYFPEEE